MEIKNYFFKFICGSKKRSRILKFRKTLHGELGWISTGLFEAIAWDSLMKSEKSTVESFKESLIEKKVSQEKFKLLYMHTHFLLTW